MLVREGKAEVFVENGVFYNPRMKFCRDADMVVFSCMDSHEYLDALAATGIRGIRACLEADFRAIFNDRNPNAVRLLRKNLEHNGLECEVLRRDAAALMRERGFEHIDLDPFGSPAEFIDSACSSVKRYLSVTATDTAALCGSATVSGLRKYSSYAEKTEFYPELGLRVLAGKIAREATKYDKAMEVLISWAREHYYRIHVFFRRSPRRAGKVYEKLGYLFYCTKCLRREWRPMDGSVVEKCVCGNKYTMMGPLWLGELHNEEFVSKAVEKAVEISSDEVRNLFTRIAEEIDVPFYYELHILAKLAGKSPPPLQNVIEGLKDRGFKASRTRCSGTGFKTDADIEDIMSILEKL
ncbi:tRNA (guanine(10)-N(2))-dimethyltransferase [Archaeoglobus veneficus]|uniref:tRNA (guanine(26)-N(2))-dimethyltransferase n=1 Tax=Archaeoglobus veneficus (strain DSM 11195 / SNP6) TaxID=693661 RepID=F2KQP1_ARCVS|nr:tRNA (guanine(10)-N(2))-dimethyltransferase [Archaeoglobus veneficus]AEA46603.1 N(2),N(2)-dimethylguanosine tRNA methyltransferase [Archaeoglobus veneficus SNP6]